MPPKKLLSWLKKASAKVKKRLINRWMKAFLLVLLIVGSILGLVLFLRSNFWSIKKISCSLICSPEIEDQLKQRALGKNVLFFPIKKITRSLLQKNPIIENIQIRRKLPSELVLVEKRRQPVVALVLESSAEGQLIADREGFIIGKTSTSSLPIILLKNNLDLNIDERISQEETLQTIKILTGLKLYSQNPKVARIISEQSLSIWLEGNQEILFSLKKEIKLQLDSLQLILSRAKIEGRKVDRVDLRFDKPVVTYG